MSEFYSVIQLLATLAIGFVLLGYTEYFLKALKINFFHVDDTIDNAEDDCFSYLPDKDTIDSLTPTEVGNANTSKMIEELKIARAEMEKKIKDFAQQSRNYFERMNELRSLQPMSMFVFMASVVLLFVPGLRLQYHELVTLFVLPFSSLCVLYILLGWIFGEKGFKAKLLKFYLMRHSIIGFAIIFVISIVFAFVAWWLTLDIGDSWKYMFVVLVIFGWLNFIIYALFIKYHAAKLNKTIEGWKKPVIDECKAKNLKKQCDDLFVVMQVAQQAAKLTADFTKQPETANQK